MLARILIMWVSVAFLVFGCSEVPNGHFGSQDGSFSHDSGGSGGITLVRGFGGVGGQGGTVPDPTSQGSGGASPDDAGHLPEGSGGTRPSVGGRGGGLGGDSNGGVGGGMVGGGGVGNVPCVWTYVDGKLTCVPQ